MKKILAVLMCVAMLVSLAACGSDVKEISRGTISGDVYTNDFGGFTFTKNADWRFLSDEELAQTFNELQADADLNALEDAFLETSVVYDMSAMDDFGNNVAVYYEDTYDTVTIDEYMEDFNDVMLEDDGDGYVYTHVSTEEVTLGSTTFTRSLFSVDVEGFTVEQAYYVRLIDNYAVIILVSAITTPIESIEAMFR